MQEKVTALTLSVNRKASVNGKANYCCAHMHQTSITPALSAGQMPQMTATRACKALQPLFTSEWPAQGQYSTQNRTDGAVCTLGACSSQPAWKINSSRTLPELVSPVQTEPIKVHKAQSARSIIVVCRALCKSVSLLVQACDSQLLYFRAAEGWSQAWLSSRQLPCNRWHFAQARFILEPYFYKCKWLMQVNDFTAGQWAAMQAAKEGTFRNWMFK